jgi:hypothetical protein
MKRMPFVPNLSISTGLSSERERDCLPHALASSSARFEILVLGYSCEGPKSESPI